MYSDLDIHSANLPRYVRALLGSLQFDGNSVDALSQLDNSEWQSLLQLSDSAQLTLLFGELAARHLPRHISERIERNYRDNSIRFARLNEAVLQIASAFKQRSIEFVVLKGFTQSLHFISDAALRTQCDIDLWFQNGSVFTARDHLLDLGYRPVGKSKGRHLDPMIREKEAVWRGDYFAPELPIAIDLHYKLWDADLERIPGPCDAEIWARQCPLTLPNGDIASQLSLTDTLAFAALHSLMHLLHGDLRLQRAWEIAYFLQHHDDNFWREWQDLYSEELRRLQLVVFLLSHIWFGCRLPDRVKTLVDELPADLQLWIRHYAWAPVESLCQPNKHELWLHLALLDSFANKAKIFVRRLLPVHAIDVGGELLNGKATAGTRPLWQRAAHHLKVVPKTCWGALAWWCRRQQLGRQFVLFALASGIFDLGEFVFFLLYNLYLMQRGFQEQELGRIAAALTMGTFVGAVPASAYMRRFGLVSGLRTAVAGTAVAGVTRALWISHPALLISAFLNGVFMAFWAVSIPPVVAGLTKPQNRTRAFSIITSIGIGVGGVAGVVGGHLPALLKRVSPGVPMFAPQQDALLAGCALATLALTPLSRLRLPEVPVAVSSERTFPRSRFAVTFFSALLIWSLGTGGFNPFFSIFFARHLHIGTEQIGLIFSIAQFGQVLAILVMPSLLKRMDEIRSITALQVITAGLLALLALVTQPVVAGLIYVGYMSFQYASEPYLLGLLMNGVATSEQKGASALYFMVTSLAGIVAAAAAGAMFEHVGYQSTILVCAGVSCLAALLYWRFLRL